MTTEWERLRMRRLGYGVTQKEVAERLGVASSYVSMHEKGRLALPGSDDFARRYAECIEELIKGASDNEQPRGIV